MERNKSLDNPWAQLSAKGEKAMYADTRGTSFSNVAVRHTVGTVGLLESTILPSISIQYVIACFRMEFDWRRVLTSFEQWWIGYSCLRRRRVY